MNSNGNVSLESWQKKIKFALSKGAFKQLPWEPVGMYKSNHFTQSHFKIDCFFFLSDAARINTFIHHSDKFKWNLLSTHCINWFISISPKLYNKCTAQNIFIEYCDIAALVETSPWKISQFIHKTEKFTGPIISVHFDHFFSFSLNNNWPLKRIEICNFCISLESTWLYRWDQRKKGPNWIIFVACSWNGNSTSIRVRIQFKIDFG